MMASAHSVLSALVTPYPSELKMAPSLPAMIREYSDKYNSDPNALVKAISEEEMWRFFIDFYRQGSIDGRKVGWLLFTEFNYLKLLTQAFQIMMRTRLNHNSPDFPNSLITLMKALHAKALEHALVDEAGHFKSLVHGYGLTDKSNSTLEGFKELLNEVQKGNFSLVKLKGHDLPVAITAEVARSLNEDEKEKLYEEYVMEPASGPRLKSIKVYPTIRHLTPAAMQAEIEDTIKQGAIEYQKKILTAVSAEEKIEAIAIFTAKFVKYHPFVNGNARIMGILMPNFLLKENGFPLAMVDPNRAGGYSSAQWLKEIMIGMGRALLLAAEPEKLAAHSGRTTAEVMVAASDAKKKYFLEIVELERAGRVERARAPTVENEGSNGAVPVEIKSSPRAP